MSPIANGIGVLGTSALYQALVPVLSRYGVLKGVLFPIHSMLHMLDEYLFIRYVAEQYREGKIQPPKP